MVKLFLSYGVNPLAGFKLMVDSQDPPSWTQVVQQFLSNRKRRRVEVSLGTMVPEVSQSKFQTLTKLRFFIALEAEAEERRKPVPLLGSPTGIQVYEHGQGQERYKTEVVKFQLGRSEHV